MQTSKVNDAQKVYVVLAKLDPSFASITQVIKVFSSKEKAKQFVTDGNTFFSKLNKIVDETFWENCKRELARSHFMWDTVVRMELKKRISDKDHIYYDIIVSDESIFFDGFFYYKEVELE